MNKGIVMSVGRSRLVVMTPNGQFLSVPRRKHSCQIGEEIEFVEHRALWRQRSVRMTSAWVAAAMVVMLLVSTFGGFGGGTAVAAYITVDINPSVELAIDEDGMVVQLKGLNDDGKKLIQSVPYKDEPVENVTKSLVDKASQSGYFADRQGEIIITSTAMNDHAVSREQEWIDKVEEKVQKAANQVQSKQDTSSIHVIAISAPKELREEAVRKGVSPAKMAVGLMIGKKQGTQPSPEQLQNKTIGELTKPLGGVEKVLGEDKTVTKKELKELVKEAKEEEHLKTDKAKADSSKKAGAEQSGNSVKAGKGKGQAKDEEKRTENKLKPKQKAPENNKKAAEHKESYDGGHSDSSPPIKPKKDDDSSEKRQDLQNDAGSDPDRARQSGWKQPQDNPGEERKSQDEKKQDEKEDRHSERKSEGTHSDKRDKTQD